MTEGGTLTLQSDLPLGHYYLKEVSTADGYICADTIYPWTSTMLGRMF